jgi:alpha-glucoside transport system substrate-binding protein
MSPEELQQAIERPTDRVGVHYAPGLVAQIVTDVADHAAALPLLQFALTELFDHRRGRTIDLATYHELGGAAGALAQRADDVYDTLSPAAHETTRQVMLRLVHVGDGDDDVTRRRILLQELVGLDDERVTEVVDALAAERLLAFDRDPVTRSPTVEISHEALFSEWTRLRIWIAEARDDVRRHHRLAQAAQEWRTASESSDYLLGGARLDEALGLADRSDIRLTPPERSFLDASIEHREAERTAERAQRTREMRLRRKSRRRAGVLIGSAIALIAVTTVALTQRAHSRAAARVTAASAEAHRLAVASASVADKQPDLAILLALQSLSTSEHEHLAAASGAEDALHWAIQGAGLTYPTANAPIDVRTGPNGLTGVFRLPLADLVGLARRHLTRGFTSAECAHYSLHPCPSGTHGLASPARFGQAPIPSSVPETGRVRTGTPLAGTTVTVLEDPGDSRRFTSELQAFESATGISVDEVESEPVNAPLVDRLPKGGRPDITLSYSPGVLRDLAARGQLVDLATYLDRSSLQTDVGDEFTTIATVGSGLYFLPMAFDLKGLVWYPVGAFRQAGYQVPHTMDELVALAKRMAAAGQSPWCLGNGQGAASGWTVTDWLEAMVLRVGGPQRYDGWTTHEVPFDDPGIEQAGALLNRALFEPGFIHGAPTWPVQRDPGYAVQELGLHPPECLMVEGASFLGAGVTGLGKDLDYFTLPPIGRGTAPVALGGDVMAAAMHDRPEVRELMRYIAGPSWGHVAMSQPNISFIPARTNFDIVDCVDHSASLAANGVRVRLCQDARAALQSGRWRFDASDEMPVAIGGVDESGKPGAFLTGMLDYVAQGPSSLNGILTRIERAWPPA